MRIAELARRSGTTKETIHFYLREGLLRKPKKTSRNMAYYDETHLEQLKLIKRLKTESYLPLHVIKKILKQGKLGTSARNLDLAGELFGHGARADFEPLSKKELAERTSLSEKRITAYENEGLLRPDRVGRSKRYGYDDVRVAELLHLAEEEAGEGGENQVLERFAIIEKHVGVMVQEEMSHFFSRVLGEGDPQRALRMLRGGRESVARFLAISRARHLRRDVEALLPQLETSFRGSSPEPLYFPLGDKTKEALDVASFREPLQEKFEKHPEQVANGVALLRHLVWVGEAEEALEKYEQVKGRARDDKAIITLYGEALLQAEKFDEAFEVLERLRDRFKKPHPVVEALWAATVLIRVRENFSKLLSNTELIGYLARVFPAFENARDGQVEPLERARILLLIGRIGVGTPEFLGVHPQAKKDLEACLSALKEIRANNPVEDEGGFAYAELNASLFLARLATGEDKTKMEARVSALSD